MIQSTVIEDFVNKISRIKLGDYPDYFSRTRDIFDARLVTYTNKNQNWLFGAVLGEIGANTFDHNFSFSDNIIKGIFCDFESNQDFVFMCDFGAGIKSTLSKSIPEINNDLEALEIAFTKPVSGRAPELRGNGLKFVISSIVENKWNLFFQSGNAVCKADGKGYFFEKSDYNHNGCFCVLSCKEF